MTERKKSLIEKDLGQKKSLYKKEDKVKNRETEAKKSPDTEVNNRMDERKKSPLEKKKYDEVKNRRKNCWKKLLKKKNKNPPVYK